MSAKSSTKETEALDWNGEAGRNWVAAQSLIDHAFRKIEDLLTDSAKKAGARSVLDVGCGTGAISLSIAREIGSDGNCTGVDIAEPMITAAIERARKDHSQAAFILADAASYPFEAGQYDMIVSRFGVMFFDDPISAFVNLRQGTKKNGRLQCIVWRSPEENPFMTVGARAARPLLPNLPPFDPDAPGQFAFAKEEVVTTILEKSGWSEIQMTSLDFDCSFPSSELEFLSTHLGAVGRVLNQVDDQTRQAVIKLMHETFAPYVDGDMVRFNAACWDISAIA